MKHDKHVLFEFPKKINIDYCVVLLAKVNILSTLIYCLYYYVTGAYLWEGDWSIFLSISFVFFFQYMKYIYFSLLASGSVLSSKYLSIYFFVTLILLLKSGLLLLNRL